MVTCRLIALRHNARRHDTKSDVNADTQGDLSSSYQGYGFAEAYLFLTHFPHMKFKQNTG